MATDKQINEWIGEAEQSIKEIEKLPEADKLKATCEFLGLDPTKEIDALYLKNLDCFRETSERMFGRFKEAVK